MKCRQMPYRNLLPLGHQVGQQLVQLQDEDGMRVFQLLELFVGNEMEAT